MSSQRQRLFPPLGVACCLTRVFLLDNCEKISKATEGVCFSNQVDTTAVIWWVSCTGFTRGLRSRTRRQHRHLKTLGCYEKLHNVCFSLRISRMLKKNQVGWWCLIKGPGHSYCEIFHGKTRKHFFIELTVPQFFSLEFNDPVTAQILLTFRMTKRQFCTVKN